MSADIVYLSLAALVDHQINGLTVVGYMEPVADIFTGSVYGKLLICQGAADDQRDQLLWKMVGAVVVGAAGYGHRQPVGSVVSQNEKICACLGRRIGAGSMKRGGLRKKEIWAV